MASRETLVTKDGYEKLEAELDHLVNVRRGEIAERIKVARDFGDIAENAEYDDAKNEQARIEGRIMQIEEKIRTATVISEVDASKVGIGAVVTVVEPGSSDTEVYTIVGSTEADPLENFVSNESPVGKALFGHAVGDVVDVSVPSGTMQLEIRKIAAK